MLNHSLITHINNNFMSLFNTVKFNNQHVTKLIKINCRGAGEYIIYGL